MAFLLKTFLEFQEFKELIRLWLAYTSLEPLEPYFICRRRNEQNQLNFLKAFLK